MRHYYPISSNRSYYGHGRFIAQPYSKQYIKAYRKNRFTHANPNKTYVKVLQYIADHDGCKRVDININVLGWKTYAKNFGVKCTAKYSRGQHSNMYAALLYLDLIDYDKKFCYHITQTGRKILENAYLNSMAKFVKEK